MRPVNWGSPINWNHHLNHGLLSWHLVTPHRTGGRTWFDLADSRFNGIFNTGMFPFESWLGPDGRPGGWGRMNFDGVTDEIALGTNASLRDLPLTYDFTVSFWFKATGTVGTTDCAFAWSGTDDILFLPNDNNTGSGGTRIFWRDLGSNIIDENGPDLSNVWHFFTFISRASDSHEAYRDGVSIGTSSATGTAGPFTETNIGSFFATSNEFVGDLDDIRVWKRAIKNQEIKEYFQLSQQFYPGILNRPSRRGVITAAAANAMPMAMDHYRRRRVA